jgi:fatty acid desaturase
MAGLAEQVAGRFEAEHELMCDARALALHAALLAGFAALCAGALPAWAFVVLGVCAYVRNFNAIHEAVHARPDRSNPLRRLRQLAMIVHGPLQLGRDELCTDHRRHHAHPGDPERDPHIAVHSERWSAALAQALFQPELAAIQHVRRERALRPPMRRALAYNAAFTAALVGFGGTDVVWWIAATRLGSTACWFIFDYMLHSPRLWGRSAALPLARPLQWLWIALFGRDNLNATRHHTLHHRFATVRDRDLPALAQYLAGRAVAADAAL